MARPLYGNGQPDARLKPNGHLGLWYERFFDGYPNDWKPKQDKKSKQIWAAEKTKWVTKATQQTQNDDACLLAARRLHELCTRLGGQTRIFTGTWHFATGMGLPHPVENGFLWHPTLGTPYIPGAAVKGLVRAWLESWAEFDDKDAGKIKRWNQLYRWFGSEDKVPDERKQARDAGFTPPSLNPDKQLDTETGRFIFFDALPVTPPRLKADVMTPHMGKWYEQGGEPSDDPAEQAERTPADWHDPNPIIFLVADKPSFQFAVAPRLPEDREELSKVIAALEEALEWLGAGAKTAVGYGQMDQDKNAESSFLASIQRAEEERARKKRDADEGARRKTELAAMDHLDRAIEQFLDERTDKNQSETSALIQAIESEYWQGQEKAEIIRRLKQRMQDAGEWRTESLKKSPRKDKPYMNTHKVQGWLDSES